jgi:nicotinamide-nucleotide amidase
MEGHRPGTVFFGLAIGDNVESRQVRMPGDRHRVQQFSAISLLDLLRRRLQALDG